MTSRPRICLAFDYGLRRIGIALGNTASQCARPLLTLHSRAPGQIDWDAIARLIADWDADQLVVGMPTHDDGQEGELAPRVQRFVRQLEGRYHLPVATVPEHLSSVEAQRRLAAQASASGRRTSANARGIGREAEEVDTMAAVVILETWLGRRDHLTEGAGP
jgi:putative holliday junction resolvase